MNRLLPLFLICLSCVFVNNLSAQRTFAEALEKGREALQKGDLETALKKFRAAQAFEPARRSEVDVEIDRVFERMQQQKDEAVAARIRAEQAENTAKAALSAAKAEKEKAQTAERKAKNVLDKIYFYQGRFGLAFDENTGRYGFIDKNLNTLIDYKYTKADPFQGSGFARVSNFEYDTVDVLDPETYEGNKVVVRTGGYEFLIDTLGNEFVYADMPNNISPEVRALNLTGSFRGNWSESLLQAYHLNVLFCSANNLTQLPPVIGKLKNLQYLDLSFNKLQTLPNETGNLRDLHTPNLESNELTELPDTIFSLPRLQSLSAPYNMLRQINAGLNRLHRLKSLNLGANALTQCPDVGNLKNLEYLDLSENKLEKWPEGIGRLSRLKSVNLSGNQLTDIPEELIHADNLVQLNLRNNRIRSLPARMGNLRKLQKMGISGPVSTLPESLGALGDLQELDLRNTHVSNLPRGFGRLHRLKNLFIDSPYFNSISSEIGYLTALQNLVITNSLITQIPEEIGNCSDLRTLDLSQNKLVRLPHEIGNLQKLDWLYLYNNQLTSLPKEIGQLKNVKKILLNTNDLKSIPIETGQLKSLKLLYLNNNNELDMSSVANAFRDYGNPVVITSQYRRNDADTNYTYIAVSETVKPASDIGRIRNLVLVNLSSSTADLSDFFRGLQYCPKRICLRSDGSKYDEILGNQNLTIKLNNELETLPEEIGLAKNIEMIDLNTTNLHKLPESIGQLDKLKQFSISISKLKELPATIGQLKKLKELSVSFSRISELPPQIGNLDSLEYLAISNCPLSGLCKEIGQLKNLKKLVLVETALKTLPTEIRQLENLEDLDISSNLIEEMPETLVRLKNLKRLNLSNNSIPREAYLLLREKLPDCKIYWSPRTAADWFRAKNYPKAYEELKMELSADSLSIQKWLSLGKYALYAGDPAGCIAAMEKPLLKNNESASHYSFLALGYLFDGQYAKAEQLYINYKNYLFAYHVNVAGHTFLANIQDLESAGITHPDFEKIKTLLKKE